MYKEIYWENQLASSSNNQGSSHPRDLKILPNRFVTFKVKRQTYNGKAAFAIFMSDATKKIRSRVEKMRTQEYQQQAQQAESYTATMSHEMRTPIASALFFMRSIMKMAGI